MSRGEYKKLPKKESSFLCSDKMIISLKEARKLLGKDDSEKISDHDLAVMIGSMSKMADCLLNAKIVPKNHMAV